MLLLALDLLSKLYFSTQLPYMTLYNPGIAFSFMKHWDLAPFVFCALNIIVGSAIIAYLCHQRSRLTPLITVGFLLISCGALGNAFDRLLNLALGRSPFVTDFINYGVFIGNIADIYVCVGAAIYCIGFVKNSIK